MSLDDAVLRQHMPHVGEAAAPTLSHQEASLAARTPSFHIA
jgi:hypothetical protein